MIMNHEFTQYMSLLPFMLKDSNTICTYRKQNVLLFICDEPVSVFNYTSSRHLPTLIIIRLLPSFLYNQIIFCQDQSSKSSKKKKV